MTVEKKAITMKPSLVNTAPPATRFARRSLAALLTANSLAGDAAALSEDIMKSISSASSGNLDSAKAVAKGDVVFGMEGSSAALASGLAANCGMGPGDIAAAIDKVSVADVKKVLSGKPAMAAVGDLSMVPYSRDLV